MQNVSGLIYASTLLTALSLLSSCGGSSSESSDGRSGSLNKTGELSLNITDAVIDSAQEVWVQFTGVTIQPSDSEAITVTFKDAKNIDLLSLRGTNFTPLIESKTLQAGDYDWIRLQVNAIEDGIYDSFIILDDGSKHELSIPSGFQTGLKINTGFELEEASTLRLMVDFDLRKSVVFSSGSYSLRPTLRMVDMDEVDNISGSIDVAMYCTDTELTTGTAVYLYEGHDVVPDDLDNKKPEPLITAPVKLNAVSGLYEYVIGYVPEGSYTLAFTCQSDLDDPTTNEDIVFSYQKNIDVEVEDRKDDDDYEIEPVR